MKRPGLALRMTLYVALFAVAVFALRHEPARVLSAPDVSSLALDIPRARPAVERVLEKGGPTPFDKPHEAAEFFKQQRLAPGASDLPIQELYELRNELSLRRASRLGTSGLPAGPGGVLGWSSVGPGNIGGRTRALVIDPTNTNVMYAGGVAGGVWKSIDAGASWFPTDDQMENLAVTTIVMDPTDNLTLYAGTGEGFGNGVFVQGLGVFKTTNGGASWTQLTATANPAFYWVNKLVISPNDASTLYAGTRHGVYKTIDGGQTWAVVLANPFYASHTAQTNGSPLGCMDVAVRSDQNPDVLFASFGSTQPDGLFRSDDGGSSWLSYGTPPQQGRMMIAIAPSNNDRIYLTMADNGSGVQYGRLVSIFRSDDGVSFNSVLDFSHPFSPWLMSYASIATGCVQAPVIYSQGWYDNTIAVDPLDPDIVWVGGIDTYRSNDAGVTFEMGGYWFGYQEETPPPTYIHPDQHSITFHPDYDGVTNQTLFYTNDGGLFRTQNARDSTTLEECPIDSFPGPPPQIVWESLNNGYGVTQYYHGDVAKDAEIFVGGSQDNGTSRGLSASTPNDWNIIYGGDGGYVAIHPTNSQTMYVEIQGFPTILKSTDGGDSFSPAVNGITDTDGIFINPYAMDQANPDILWTGGQRPWRTTDGAANWELVGPNFDGPANISAIGIAPSDPNIVYLGFTNGYVVRTINGLDPNPTWDIFTNGLYGGWVSSIAVDYADPDLAYATYSNYGIPHVVRTIDGGLTWTVRDGSGANTIPDLPAHWLAIRPCDPQQLYLGTELGVFASDDGGANWSPSNEGFPFTVVEALDFRNADQLVAFTFGRGVFWTDLTPCATVGVETPVLASAQLSASPSPFRSSTRIRGVLPRAGQMRLAVHDAQGRLVRVMDEGVRQAGPFDITWNGTGASGQAMPPGVYFVRLETDQVLSKRVVLLR